MERCCERSIQQKERQLIAVERQCQEEDVRYRNEVKEEVMGRMDYLRAEGERIRMDYEETLREEEQKAEEQHMKDEAESRLRAK